MQLFPFARNVCMLLIIASQLNFYRIPVVLFLQMKFSIFFIQVMSAQAAQSDDNVEKFFPLILLRNLK